jgi:hypothetical protein
MAKRDEQKAEAAEARAEAKAEAAKPVSFEESILTEGKAPVPDAEMPLSDPDFQALMRTECEFREQSGLPVDESVLQAVRSRWAVLKAAKQAKA